MLKQFYYKKNRLQQLRGFCCAAQVNSISKAAKMMNLNQSTITLQIQSLERDMKAKLFIRNSKGLKLTEDGDLLYKLALEHLNAIEGIFDNFLKNKDLNRVNKITIAAHHVVISFLLPKYLAKFTKKYPDIEISIKNISLEEAVKKLKENKLDFIIYPDMLTDRDLENIKLTSYDPVLIMNKNHPLKNKKNITLEDIAKFNCIRIDKNLIALSGFENNFEKYNFKTNIEFENANWDIIKHFVKSDIGLGFVSTICIDPGDKEVTYRKLNKFFPQMEYSIASKKGKIHSDLSKKLIEFILSDVRKSSLGSSDFPI